MIDSALYQAPQGLGSLPDENVEIEIEEEKEDPSDGVTIDLDPRQSEEKDDDFDSNLAEHIDDGTLASIGYDLVSEVESDINSRKDWVEMFVRGLEVLGMKYEERTEPWNGACGVFSTILTEAAVRFQSETILETFPAAGPVKTEIMGAINKLKDCLLYTSDAADE